MRSPAKAIWSILLAMLLLAGCGQGATTAGSTSINSSPATASVSSSPLPSTSQPVTVTATQPASTAATTTKAPSSAAVTTKATTPTTISASATAGNTVTVKNFAFNPPQLTVPVGATVTWTNLDPDTHSATSVTGGVFDLPLPGSGGKASFTFTKAGQYFYFCKYHAEMTGVIVVQ